MAALTLESGIECTIARLDALVHEHVARLGSMPEALRMTAAQLRQLDEDAKRRGAKLASAELGAPTLNGVPIQMTDAENSAVWGSLTPVEVLEAAAAGDELTRVTVIGVRRSGQSYVLASSNDAALALWDLENARTIILRNAGLL